MELMAGEIDSGSGSQPDKRVPFLRVSEERKTRMVFRDWVGVWVSMARASCYAAMVLNCSWASALSGQKGLSTAGSPSS